MAKMKCYYCGNEWFANREIFVWKCRRCHRVNRKPKLTHSLPVIPYKKIVALISVLAIVVIILWQSPTIISVFNSSSPSNAFSGYTKVTLVTNQPNSVQFGNNVYGLGYAGPSTDFYGKTQNQFDVVPAGIIGTKYYNAVQGATYNDLGLQIVVGEVHNDYLILWIKSTVP